MSRKREISEYRAAEGSPTFSYQLPAHGSPRAEPSTPLREPPLREPGSAPPALRLPGVDDRLAIPEAGEEYLDGVRYEVMAGDPEHADPQCQLAYLVRACVAPGYIASTELLTRTDWGSDFATDVCVRRAGKDPQTGQRFLEDLSFEVANTQTLKDLEKRANKLIARGVRRVFAILVHEAKVLEWKQSRWVPPARGEIRDQAFKKPLRIQALVDAAEADRLVAEALWAKGEPFLLDLAREVEAKGRAEGEARGRTEAMRDTIRDVCAVLGIEVPAELSPSLADMSRAELDLLRAHLVAQKSWPHDR